MKKILFIFFYAYLNASHTIENPLEALQADCSAAQSTETFKKALTTHVATCLFDPQKETVELFLKPAQYSKTWHYGFSGVKNKTVIHHAMRYTAQEMTFFSKESQKLFRRDKIYEVRHVEAFLFDQSAIKVLLSLFNHIKPGIMQSCKKRSAEIQKFLINDQNEILQNDENKWEKNTNQVLYLASSVYSEGQRLSL